MLTRLLAMMRKEFVQIRRDPRTLALVVLMPAMQLLLFGYAINTTVDHIPLAVLDQARDRHSRELVAAFRNSSYFDVTAWPADREGLRRAVDSGQAHAGLLIPPDFTPNLLGGRSAQVQLVIDGTDPNTASTALFAAGSVAQARAADLQVASLARSGVPAPTTPLDLRPVVLYNPGMQSVVFMIPGLVGIILQLQTLLLTATAVVREREMGTLEQLIVTPVQPLELMLGKLLPYALLSLGVIGVAVTLGRVWFGVEIAGSLGLLALFSGTFLLASLGIGLFLSTVSQTQMQATQLAFFVIMPSFLLSGFVFPREAMPAVIQWLGWLVPLTYFLQLIRGVMLKGTGLDVLWPYFLPLAVFAVCIVTLSALRFRKRLA